MNRISFFFTSVFIFYFDIISFSQSGCTDWHALNFSASSTINDGSCIYPATNLPLMNLTLLDTSVLNECSGLTLLNGNLWTHVDDVDNHIYRIDSASDNIFQSVHIYNAVNNDWEDITSDAHYLYIADCGNNAGNRTDLHILRVSKDSLDVNDSSATAEYIYFSYSDQSSFVPAFNNNSFDCEAFFLFNDSIHLFTKDWVNYRTKHYIIPAIPGTYVAQLIDSFNVSCLITSAAIQANGLITLLGYNLHGSPSCVLWMLSDFPADYFFSGNKRMFSLGSPLILGQSEGICLNGNNSGFISNEKINQPPFIVPAQLRKFDLSSFVDSQSVSFINPVSKNDMASVIYSPSSQTIHVKLFPTPLMVKVITIYNSEGEVILVRKVGNADLDIPVQGFAGGNYILKISDDKTFQTEKFIVNR